MKRFLALLMIVLMTISLCGCSSITKLIINSAAAKTSASAEIISDDGKISLVVPDSWVKQDHKLNDESDYEIMNAAKEQYIIILGESKDDFDDSVDLDEFANMIIENMSTNITDAVWTTAVHETENSNPTTYIEVSGTVDKMKIQYYLEFVETGSAFYQVIGYTLKSKADANRQIIVDIMNTFKEIG